MNSTIALSFRYTEGDYVQAVRAHNARHLRLPLDIVVIVLVSGFAIYLWRFPDQHWLALLGFVVAALFTLMLVSAFTIVPRVAFRREPKFRDDYLLIFSPEGIQFRTAHIDSQLQWSLYSWALITDRSFILYYGSRQFTVIPKRIFQNQEQVLAFEELLKQRISRIERRTHKI
jgi:hypothetical protein